MISLFFLTFFDYGSLFFGNRGWYRDAGDFGYGGKFCWADFETGAALGAFLLIDDVNQFFAADNRVGRAFFKARPASLAFCRVNIEGDKLFAGERRTAFLLNVGLIFISEVA